MNRQDLQVTVQTIQANPDQVFECLHHFKGLGTHPSVVNVKMWTFGHLVFVLFTDIGNGTSVTNASEQLVEEIYFLYLTRFKKEHCLFAETYEGKNEAVDFVLPEWVHNRVISVDWLHFGKRLNGN